MVSRVFPRPSKQCIRKVIYTTNAIESLNMSLREVIKTKGVFPHEEAVFKVLWRATAEAKEGIAAFLGEHTATW